MAVCTGLLVEFIEPLLSALLVSLELEVEVLGGARAAGLLRHAHHHKRRHLALPALVLAAVSVLTGPLHHHPGAGPLTRLKQVVLENVVSFPQSAAKLVAAKRFVSVQKEKNMVNPN